MLERLLLPEHHAIAILIKDHDTVKDLFDRFEKSESGPEKQKIIKEALNELKIHAVIEEKIFYPAVRKYVEKDLMNEADEEHHVAKLLIAELGGNSVMVRMISDLFDERHSPISAKLSSRYENTRTWNLALKEHEAVLRALEARDPLAAQAAILTHLKASEDRWIAD